MPGDANKDNVYEVTLVVTDSLGKMGTYPVTVKVINSTEDNKPGEVKILNQVPEVATALVAEFDDDDKPIRDLKWQWYRSAENGRPHQPTDAQVARPIDPTTTDATANRQSFQPTETFC